MEERLEAEGEEARGGPCKGGVDSILVVESKRRYLDSEEDRSLSSA